MQRRNFLKGIFAAAVATATVKVAIRDESFNSYALPPRGIRVQFFDVGGNAGPVVVAHNVKEWPDCPDDTMYFLNLEGIGRTPDGEFVALPGHERGSSLLYIGGNPATSL